MDVQTLAELTSLALTVPTLILAAMVVHVWGPSALHALRDWPDLNGQQWLIVGVVAGFVGQFADNLYWTVPWTAAFFDMGTKAALVDAGVYFNIISRQSMGIFAAFCHLKAGALSESRVVRLLNQTLALSYVGAVAGAVLLWGLKCS